MKSRWEFAGPGDRRYVFECYALADGRAKSQAGWYVTCNGVTRRIRDASVDEDPDTDWEMRRDLMRAFDEIVGG